MMEVRRAQPVCSGRAPPRTRPPAGPTAGPLGRRYGARNTPQYAIIAPQGVLRFAGAIDDKPSPNVKVVARATNYVRAALDAGLAGNPIAVAQTQPCGCDATY